MRKHSRRRTVRSVLLFLLAAAVVWQGFLLFRQLRSRPSGLTTGTRTVVVSGNVDRPGRYRVPEGTSHFEILRVAGMRMNSDFSAFQLLNELENGQSLNVGTRDVAVEASDYARVEFFLGTINVIAQDGRVRSVEEGMNLAEGDRVLCEERSQVELSVNGYSRIDLDHFAEVVFDRIGAREQDRSVVDIFQKNGLCWYKMVYSKKGEQFQVTTPLGVITVGGKGADFSVTVRYTDVLIENTDGVLLVERGQTKEAVNLIAGQSLLIHADKRPFDVAKLTPEFSLQERFTQLTRLKTDLLVTQLPFNLFICGQPSVYFLLSMQFDRSRIVIIRLPPQTSVNEFAKGIHTLQEAFVYGGPVFASTFVERIMNTRVPKFLSLNKFDMLRIAQILKGVEVTVDDDAASHLNIPRGRQRLEGEKLVEFLKPSLSGAADSEQRQIEFFQALFEALSSRKLVITSLLADQMLSNLETNVSATELLRNYKALTGRANWRNLRYTLPTRSFTRENRQVQEPILDDCRALLAAE